MFLISTRWQSRAYLENFWSREEYCCGWLGKIIAAKDTLHIPVESRWASWVPLLCCLEIKSMVLTAHTKNNNIYFVVTLKSPALLQIALKLFIKLYFLLFNSRTVWLGEPPSDKPKPQTWYIHRTAHSAIYIIKKYTVYSGTKLKNNENNGNEG